jgi:hypothetical protein
MAGGTVTPPCHTYLINRNEENNMETAQIIHEPLTYSDGSYCDGKRLLPLFGPTKCEECGTPLCACQVAYGHDCE